MSSEHPDLVHLDVADGTATITLDSPSNRNALSRRLRAELAARFEAALLDDDVRVIVLTHTGPVFCAGMDLRESRGASGDEQGVQEFPRLLQTIWESDKPVIARLAGPARAGGVGLVAACDIAVATRAASFGFSEVRIGVVPAVISATVLPRLLPRAAHELFLTGEVFDAERAVAIGLLNAVVDDGADGPDPSPLDVEVARFRDMLARGAPRALAATKAMLRRSPAETMALDLEAMLALSAEHFASAEGQEGMAAFAEKRPAAWVPEGLR